MVATIIFRLWLKCCRQSMTGPRYLSSSAGRNHWFLCPTHLRILCALVHRIRRCEETVRAEDQNLTSIFHNFSRVMVLNLMNREVKHSYNSRDLLSDSPHSREPWQVGFVDVLCSRFTVPILPFVIWVDTAFLKVAATPQASLLSDCPVSEAFSTVQIHTPTFGWFYFPIIFLQNVSKHIRYDLWSILQSCLLNVPSFTKTSSKYQAVSSFSHASHTEFCVPFNPLSKALIAVLTVLWYAEISALLLPSMVIL